ncbi:hypothetical protein L596_010553 [Steinernema carpocapsae]|uniref:Uncharacterized protein n=1 Tax=Steinernema carpocapsae TaxID=34508 RepID=A0A4U5PIP5_STECR|nr:hypothetical protein L596_010553 [Steinernema carpocapsae]
MDSGATTMSLSHNRPNASLPTAVIVLSFINTGLCGRAERPAVIVVRAAIFHISSLESHTSLSRRSIIASGSTVVHVSKGSGGQSEEDGNDKETPHAD